MFEALSWWLRRPASEFYAWVVVPTARAYGLTARVTSVRRTRAEQARLYDRYQRGLSAFPAAPPGRSRHEQGRAFDVVVLDARGRVRADVLSALGHYWRSLGGNWYSSDVIHFEA